MNNKDIWDGAYEALEHQLQDNYPPEVKKTLKRLVSLGHNEMAAKKMMAHCLLVDLLESLADGKESDGLAYTANLKALPTMPILDNDKYELIDPDEFDETTSEIQLHKSRDHLSGLCVVDIQGLMYCKFDEDSIVRFREDVPESEYKGIGLLNLFEFILQRLQVDAGIKLTKLNNLNTKLVTEIYEANFTQERVVELQDRTSYRQDELMTVETAYNILKVLKITKIRHNKLSLTKAGADYLKTQTIGDRFESAFLTNLYNLNWSYFDTYPEDANMQLCFGYTMYLLLKYGDSPRPFDFYVEKMLDAYPFLLDSFMNGSSSPEESFARALHIRAFERFLLWFDFVEFENGSGKLFDEERQVSAKGLKKFFRIDESNSQVKTGRVVSMRPTK